MTNFAFLHGGAQGGWVWAPVIAALERQEDNAFALDVPGCGEKRGRETASISVGDIVAELVGDIKAAGMEDVVLVGHSQAGSVMPEMARRSPGLFRHLVYLSCSIPLPGQTILDMMGSGIHGSNPDEVGWRREARAAGMRERARVQFCNDMDSREAEAFLAQLGDDMWPMASYQERDWFAGPVPVPSTYIVCLQDQVLPPDWQERFALRLHADHVVHIDAGHQAMTTRPEQVAAILGDQIVSRRQED